MAKILSEFDFGAGKGRKPMYPWGTWMDGRIRRLEPGKDFECATESMQVQIYNKARSLGGKVNVSIVDKDANGRGAIVFQFQREEVLTEL